MSEGTQLAAAVLEEIQAEIKQEGDAIVELEKQAREVGKEKDAAFDAYLGDGPDSPIDPEAERRYEQAFKTEQSIRSAISQRYKKIDRLNSPDEFDQRMEQKLQKGTKMADDNKQARTPKETARDQGVPDAYLNESGRFKIGMDARLKSDLVLAALGIEAPKALHQFSKSEAEGLIKKRGWEPFLERKKEIIAQEETRKAEAAKAKEEAAREKAEEKAKKAEAKAAAKSDSKTSGNGKSGKATSKSDQARAQREAKAGAAS